ATNAEAITERARAVLARPLPALPGWIERLPVVGARIAAAWGEFASSGGAVLHARLEPYVGVGARWGAALVGGPGALSCQFLLPVLGAGILSAAGEGAGAHLQRFARRLGGPPGEAVVLLAAQAIRSVALGVVVTAIVQAAAAGLGLLLAGVPFAAV